MSCFCTYDENKVMGYCCSKTSKIYDLGVDFQCMSHQYIILYPCVSTSIYFPALDIKPYLKSVGGLDVTITSGTMHNGSMSPAQWRRCWHPGHWMEQSVRIISVQQQRTCFMFIATVHMKIMSTGSTLCWLSFPPTASLSELSTILREVSQWSKKVSTSLSTYHI